MIHKRPEHIANPSFYIREILDSIPFQSSKDIKRHESSMTQEMQMASIPQDIYDELSFNLQLEEPLPATFGELQAMFEKDKEDLQAHLQARDHSLREKTLNALKKMEESQDISTQQKAEKRYHKLLERLDRQSLALKNKYKEFLAQWEPFSELLKKREVLLKEWRQGVLEHAKQIKNLKKQWAPEDQKISAKVPLQITFYDNASEQHLTLDVKTDIFIHNLVRQIKKEMRIALFDGEQLRLFCPSGSLDASRRLNDYRIDQITHLKLYRLQPKQQETREDG